MRHALAAFAVVLSAVVAPIGITATWLAQRVDDTDAFLDAVAPLADEPELRDALAREVSAAATARVAEVVPVASAFEDAIRASTRAVVENDAFPEFWRSANAEAHREFLAIVHDRGRGDPSGWLYLDIGPLLAEVLSDLGGLLPVRVELPSRPVLVPVVPVAELERGRAAYRALDALAWWTPLLWLVLVVVAVVAAPGFRGRLRTGAASAFGAALGAALVLASSEAMVDLVVDRAATRNQDLARLVVEVVVSSLDDAARAVAVVGGVVGVVLLAGSFVPGRRPRPYA